MEDVRSLWFELRVAVIGPDDAGKTTLCYAFSKFAEKRGVSAAVCNLNPSLKHSQYPVTWDVRSAHRVRKRDSAELKRAYQAIAEDTSVGRAIRGLNRDIVLLDFAGGLDLFLAGDAAGVLRKHADAVILLCDAAATKDGLNASALRALSDLLSGRLGIPVVSAVNKSDLLRRSKTRELGLSRFGKEESKESAGVLWLSATERSGFENLLSALKSLA